MERERQKDHRRNETLEELLQEVNGLLAEPERNAVRAFETNAWPLILIVGCGRSGSTLFLQWLASLGHFAYPTNLLSRFYGAPFIGAKIQLILTRHDFNGEIFDFNPDVPFASRLGKTKGALAPNEFWYFWRRFFHFGEIQKLDEADLERVDVAAFVREIASLEEAFGKPFAMKGMIMNWNIPFLARTVKKVLFVHVRRDPVRVMESLLRSRQDYYGDTNAWYSFKPPEYASLRNRSAHEQVAGQVFYTDQAVERGLAGVEEDRKLVVQYEDFCREPERFFESIKSRFARQGSPVEWKYSGPASFEISALRSAPEEAARLAAAYRALSESNQYG